MAALLAASPEFTVIWAEHEIGLAHTEQKTLLHPQLGPLDLWCQTLHDPGQLQTLLVFTAAPGSPSYERLQLLAAVGA